MFERSMRSLLAAAGVAMLAACATEKPPEPGIKSTGCVGDRCRVEVKVVNCTSKDGFEVTPYDLPVRQPSRIDWEIVTEGYRFKEDLGIEIKKNDGVFESPKRHGHGEKFRWRDRHQDAPDGLAVKSYHYVINVERIDGTVKCAVFDPTISNN